MQHSLANALFEMVSYSLAVLNLIETSVQEGYHVFLVPSVNMHRSHFSEVYSPKVSWLHSELKVFRQEFFHRHFSSVFSPWIFYFETRSSLVFESSLVSRPILLVRVERGIVYAQIVC